ncbi:transport and Golgi organization protein 6 homolog isoform X1 [Bombus pascuorum]|uniref:transport and Golgi organization protein 6 homolog isoform X1 n=1 Tax=Bombus pascuorum TaxID=65598 RepID=UPI00212D6354|nr:transport and Golgi organization protein 6 homolog isoform X1 [Bombus pascuorum]
MDYHEILLHLTKFNKTDYVVGKADFDENLQKILQKVQLILVKNDENLVINSIEDENEPVDIRYRYIYIIIYVLQNIKRNNSTNDKSLLSVKQFRTVKICIELVIAIGIISCLLPGVGVDMAKLCPRVMVIWKEDISDFQKYKRLKFTVNSIVELYDDIMFRPAILVQIGSIFAALLQLSYAPLIKPLENTIPIQDGNESKVKFIMTKDIYDKLKKDQEHFICLFHKLLNNCPSSICMKELMVILGIKGVPRWLQRETRKYLVQQLMQPNGIISIVTIVCENPLDYGQHWNKLDTISRLIATSHGNNFVEYYKSICSQLLNLLSSTRIMHSATIASYCITIFYEYNPIVCYENIVKVICNPLLVNLENEQKVKSEEEVEKCIENLTRCFVTTESKFKKLPSELLMKVAIPLFSLYNTVRQSAYVLKAKLKQLVLLLLYEQPLKTDLFAAFLGHNVNSNFGNYLKSKFGPTGGIEILGLDRTCKYDEFADTLFDLTFTTKALSTKLFTYLLKFLSNSIKVDQMEAQNMLETEEDTMEKMEEKLAAVKLLSSLANISVVQESQVEDPKLMFYFIKLLLNQHIKKTHDLTADEDCEILYVGLMLVKMILNEKKKSLDWTVFNDFVKFLKECCAFSNIPSQLLMLMRELIEVVETKGRPEKRHYQDVSASCKVSNKFENVIRDLADPLLPVRAHALVVLTKLIENMDPCTISKKTVLLQLFMENVKHEDSFIYLAAINGLCALATSYPEVIVKILVQEYIDIPQRISGGDINVETRVKLGEILVKMTRNLGEMVSSYKSILINGFLCAIRDADSLMRASSLSCLAELCKVLGFRLGDDVIEVIYCITSIVKTDKVPECRRAAVMVSTLLLRGLGKDTLTSLGKDLIDLYRGLKHLRDNDEDLILRLHAQQALEELDLIVQDFILATPKLEKKIIL